MKSLVWTKEKAPLGDINPSPREGHTLTYLTDLKQLLMFGGTHNNTKTNEIYLYDIEKNSWKLQQTTGKQPSPRSYHSAFYEEPYFFVYGGQGDNDKSQGDLHILNVKSWEWKLLFILEAPPARHFTTISDIDNPEKEKIIFGGISSPENKLLNDLWIVTYNVNLFTSTQPKIVGTVCTPKRANGEIPAPRKGHCAAVYNKSLIVYGGETSDPEDSNWIYQLLFDSWSWKKISGAGKPLNARSFASCCLYDKNVLLMFGGVENQTGKYLNDINILSLSDFRWSSPFIGGHLPTPRYNHASCSYETLQEGKVMVIMGGLDTNYCNIGLFKLVERERKDQQIEPKKPKESTILERKDSGNSETIISDKKNYIEQLERTISKEKNYSNELEKEIAALEKELEQVENFQKAKTRNFKDEISILDNEYATNYEATKQLFGLLQSEQLVMTEVNAKNSLLEDLVQKTESYLIALDKLFIAISKYKIDETDDQELRLRDLYENTQGEVLKLRDHHKSSLHFMKNVYDEYLHLSKRADAAIHTQRELVLEIDKSFKEILVQNETEDL